MSKFEVHPDLTRGPSEALAPLTCPAEPSSIVVQAGVNINKEPGLDDMPGPDEIRETTHLTWGHPGSSTSRACIPHTEVLSSLQWPGVQV